MSHDFFFLSTRELIQRTTGVGLLSSFNLTPTINTFHIGSELGKSGTGLIPLIGGVGSEDCR